MLAAGALLTGALLAGRVRLDRIPFGVVLPDEIAVKEGADVNYRTSFEAHAGLRVRIVDRDQDWLRVRLANGLEGWVRARRSGGFRPGTGYKGDRMAEPHFEKHVFICTNRRDPGNPKGCCAEKGSEAVRDEFKRLLHERGVKGRMRANAAGCLDQCARGVTVVVYPEQVWYGGVKVDDVREIVEEPSHRRCSGRTPADEVTGRLQSGQLWPPHPPIRPCAVCPPPGPCSTWALYSQS